MSDRKQEDIKERLRRRFDKPLKIEGVVSEKTIQLPSPSADVTVCGYLKIVREIIQEHEVRDSLPGRRVIYSVQVGGLILSLDYNENFRIRFAEEDEEDSASPRS